MLNVAKQSCLSFSERIFAMSVQTLSCHQVSKSFFQAQSEIKIFDQMSYVFQSNRSYALMGPSGVGKSTLLAMLSGIDHLCGGTIQLNDLIISHQTFQERIKLLEKNISIVFQQPCLIAELTMIENVMLKSIIQETMTKESEKRAVELLKDVGLEDKALSFSHNLSGGRQQKVSILRSIFEMPQFLLADEPTGNLDQQSAQQIISFLLSNQKKYAMGLIVSPHDIFIAQQCDQILQIQDRKL